MGKVVKFSTAKPDWPAAPVGQSETIGHVSGGGSFPREQPSRWRAAADCLVAFGLRDQAIEHEGSGCCRAAASMRLRRASSSNLCASDELRGRSTESAMPKLP